MTAEKLKTHMTEAEFEQLLCNIEREPNNPQYRNQLYNNGGSFIFWDTALANQWSLFFSNKKLQAGQRPTAQTLVTNIRNHLAQQQTFNVTRERVDSSESSDSEVDLEAAASCFPRPHSHKRVPQAQVFFHNSRKTQQRDTGFSDRAVPLRGNISPEIALCNEYMKQLFKDAVMSTLCEHIYHTRDAVKTPMPQGPEKIFALLDQERANDPRYCILRAKYRVMEQIRNKLETLNGTEEDKAALIQMIKHEKQHTFSIPRVDLFPRSMVAFVMCVIAPSLLLTKWITGYWFGEMFTTRGEQICDKLLASLEKPAEKPNPSVQLR